MTTDSVHRALAEPSRARLLDLVEAGASTVAELAQRSGLHPNTIRAHLDVLLDAGLVTAGVASTGRPGRPSRRFRAVPRGRTAEHELLAAALAGSLDPLPDGPELAEASGRSWGRFLVERLPPTEPATEASCVARVCELLAERAFAPEAAGRTIRMRACPFRELAERYPRVVCALHRGILDGALDELGAPVRVAELRPWVEPEVCEARLGPAGSPTA